MNQRFIYLASASPRRRRLLDQIGVRYEVHPVEIDETPQPGEVPRDYVKRVAREKAVAAAALLPQAAPVLAADTTVVIDGRTLGKPRDHDDALQMLGQLSDSEHEVLTAVCAIHDNEALSELSSTRVYFRNISHSEREHYWASGEPADKAGAYSIQGRGAIFIERIEGSYSGVMGLPLFETARLLGRCGIDVMDKRCA
ncbi:MAG: septum formation inhibitor Maf [Gammaproteobacteria bacterium]|nr:septum formation inhibitor Maf [Gammaproteobacteria bacterium]NNF62022.1 septum formation inhibitor Maf [Gammaproteobacteria bacterium]NNM19900.1 septum formation inhibitor Maf [Gammaproteobacteria bacterium]